jgi:TolA-binding protein
MLLSEVRRIILFVVLSILFSISVSATELDPNIIMQFRPLQMPDPFQQRQQYESIRMQQEQIRMMQEQRREMEYRNNQERENQIREEEQRIKIAQDKSELDSAMQEWLKMASPRLHLYQDFDKVVYLNDVAITNDMIRIMAKSKYAADIAYYFGKHKTESLAISKMPLPEASTAISDVEGRIKKTLKKIKR